MNEDFDDIIKIVESLENSGLLIDGASEKVKHEIKKTRRWISSCYGGTCACFIDSIMTSSLIQPVALSLINAITGKGVMRTRRWMSSIISIAFNDESSGKRSHKSKKRI